MAEAIQVLQSTEQAQAALHPVRLRILDALAEPASASAIAPKLAMPRQLVNYHLRELESAGLVRLIEERKKRNCIERVYERLGDSLVVGPEALGKVAANPAKLKDQASSDYLVSVANRIIGEIASHRATNDATPTLTMESLIAFVNDADRADFAHDLAIAMAEVIREYHQPGPNSQTFRLVVAAHPPAGNGDNS